MAKISFLGLGGLDEKEKSCYALTINGDIYILNCGLVTPPGASLGVKKIIPDFSWIISNRSAIKGIFIGTPKYSNFAALPYLLKALPNVPVYVSDIGASIIANYFKHRMYAYHEQFTKINFRIMTPLRQEHIGNAIVTAIRISNYLPKSYGYVFNTQDGAIIFIDEFMVNPNRNAAFEDQIFQINYITKGKNLLLITSVGNVSKNNGFTNPSHRVINFFNNIINENREGKTYIACQDYDMYKILSIANICAIKSRPFTIYSHTTSKTFDDLRHKQYFKNQKLLTLPEKEMMNSKNGIVVIAGSPHKLISKVEKIVTGEDPIMKINPEDYFVYAIETTPGYEKNEAILFDQIVRSNPKKVIRLSKDILLASPSTEDHKFLIDLLRPQYAIPVNGLYMNFVEYRNAVIQSYISKNNVILLTNGEVVELNSGVYQKGKSVKLQLQFVNATGTIDTGSASLFERDQMKEHGAIMVSLLINKAQKCVVRYSFEPLGVVNHDPESTALVNEINQTCLKLINEYLEKNIVSQSAPLDTREFKYYIKKIFSKWYDKKFTKKPLVVTSLIFQKDQSNQSDKQEENITVEDDD